MLHRQAQNMVVVLNQASRLPDDDVARCLTDLRRLHGADGLGSVPLLATSATGPRPGIVELRGTLEHAVAERLAALRRLSADVDGAVDGLKPLVGPAGSAGGAPPRRTPGPARAPPARARRAGGTRCPGPAAALP